MPVLCELESAIPISLAERFLQAFDDSTNLLAHFPRSITALEIGARTTSSNSSEW